MSICNMAIEAGASGMIFPMRSPTNLKTDLWRQETWEKAIAYWKTLSTDADAKFDKVVVIDAKDIEQAITWGAITTRYGWHFCRTKSR